MTEMGITLGTRGHCSCFGFCERKLVSDKYDFGFRRSLLEDTDELSAVDLRAILGRQIVSGLPTPFRIRNNGRFIAVTFTGKILAVCDTLESLNEEIARKNLKENYYIERLGHSTIAQI
ncbi:hypothetical protein MUP01_05420 [Candidatus Bathyarchaeota archaeon]|nr:hypothetical protein [Candidatus Bathyarchaeota archaeon]